MACGTGRDERAAKGAAEVWLDMRDTFSQQLVWGISIVRNDFGMIEA